MESLEYFMGSREECSIGDQHSNPALESSSRIQLSYTGFTGIYRETPEVANILESRAGLQGLTGMA